MKPVRLGMLVSGGGRTFQNMVEACRRGEVPGEVVALVSSSPKAYALERAKKLGIPASVVRPRDCSGPKELGERTFAFLRKHGVQWALMGGYMHHILVPEDFTGRVLNIHPALIPSFCGKGMYGHHVHEAVLKAGVKVTGVTVHFVDDEYDHGPIVHQVAVPVEPGDTVETLAARVFEAEKRAYPEAVRRVLAEEAGARPEGGNERVTRFYLVRHGETELNRTDCFRGAVDVELNDLGRRQAAQVGRALEKVPFTAVLSSPMKRAWYTAQRISEARGLSPRPEPAFRNIDLGPWNGKPKKEVQKERPDLWEKWLTHPESLEIPGAETLRQVQERAWNRLLELLEEFRGETLVLATHTTVIKPILARALSVPEPWFWRFHIDHAAYAVLEHRSLRGWCLAASNRTDHLETFRPEPA